MVYYSAIGSHEWDHRMKDWRNGREQLNRTSRIAPTKRPTAYTTITVQKPYCSPARYKILSALQPYGVIVGDTDIEEKVVRTSIKTLLQRMKIELRTWENLKYGGPIGLAMYLPSAIEAKIRVRTSQAEFAKYLLAASGKLTIENDADGKSAKAGYNRNGIMPTASDPRRTRKYVLDKTKSVQIAEPECAEGKALWKQFNDAAAVAKKVQAKGKRK
ncbi:MAG: hypothetical protein WBD37_02135 [Anderseniella sp.]